MSAQYLYTEWQDASATTRLTRISATAPLSILSQVELLTRAVPATITTGVPTVVGGTPSALPIASNAVTVRLVFECVDTTVATVTIPAPLSTLIDGNGNIIASTVSGLVTACIGNLTSASGSLAVTLIGGTLVTGRN